ncbi:MAG TPA: hypothetical protein ACQGQH_06330 [Xylella sp.]
MRELGKVEIEHISGASTNTTVWSDIVAATNSIFGGVVTSTNGVVGGFFKDTNNIFSWFTNTTFFREYISISSLFSDGTAAIDKKS